MSIKYDWEPLLQHYFARRYFQNQRIHILCSSCRYLVNSILLYITDWKFLLFSNQVRIMVLTLLLCAKRRELIWELAKFFYMFICAISWNTFSRFRQFCNIFHYSGYILCSNRNLYSKLTISFYQVVYFVLWEFAK